MQLLLHDHGRADDIDLVLVHHLVDSLIDRVATLELLLLL